MMLHATVVHRLLSSSRTHSPDQWLHLLEIPRMEGIGCNHRYWRMIVNPNVLRGMNEYTSRKGRVGLRQSQKDEAQ